MPLSVRALRLATFATLAVSVGPLFAQTKITERQSPADEKKCFVLPAGFEIELVSAEPQVINPVTLQLDDENRLVVSESHTYRYGPTGTPIKPYTNPVVRLDRAAGGQENLQRFVVADGFEDPVMGMVFRGGKFWAAANDYLFLFDLNDAGQATNRRTLLKDNNKAWNPFGMFVLEWGPDGQLYMSVGNHAIDIHGPTNQISSRGNSGIVLRMQPDGSHMQRLLHGVRVPYSFDYDPFGQLWLLSNGQGNPDRFIKVIDGVDYHCYSRPAVDAAWLTGQNPLAPPCLELPRGACTQLIRYYAAAYPRSYQGSLFLDNWGAHGFDGIDRTIFRYVPDDRGQIIAKEEFLTCTDPHFRPSHILVDPDGNLLVADWYGRDDESDLTGRVWRVRYTGSDKPVVSQQLDSPRWSDDSYAIAALGSPQHQIREKAIRQLIGRGNRIVPALGAHAAQAPEPLGAAYALWALLRIGTPESQAALAQGAQHPNWHVRRLAMNIVRIHHLSGAVDLARQLANDKDPAVRVEAALACSDPAELCSALIGALEFGAAHDPWLRYESAWHLAEKGNASTFKKLLVTDDEDLRLAALIALDIACFENFSSKSDAITTIAALLTEPTARQFDLVLTLAKLNWNPSFAPPLEKLALRSDLPLEVSSRALPILRAESAKESRGVIEASRKRFVEAVEKGLINVSTPVEATLLLEFLENEGPSKFGIDQLRGMLGSSDASVRKRACRLARRFGPPANSLSEQLWRNLAEVRKTKPEERVEILATLAAVETPHNARHWEQQLLNTNKSVQAEAIRWWRLFKDDPKLIAILVKHTPELLKQMPGLKGELAVVLTSLGVDESAQRELGLTDKPLDKSALAALALKTAAKVSDEQRPLRALQGEMVFQRNACVKCHTTVSQDSPLAPSLKGIGKSQKPEYLVESVLAPSQVIKTGFETESILTTDGRSFSGLVKDEGANLRVRNLLEDVLIKKSDVEERAIQKISIMPEGQEKLLGPREFEDLLIYLQSMK